MKVWKLFFIYTRGKGKNPFFHFSDFLDFPKILKKEYNIRFKIYPSPFTSSPQHDFHIFFIGDILLSIGDNFLSIGVIFLSFGDIFRMISWYFLYFISRIHANRTNRIGRKRKCCIFATSIRSNNEMQDCWKKQHKNLEVRIIQRNFADEIKQETRCKQANTY